MFSIRRDSKNNILTITFRGILDGRQGVQLLKKVSKELPRLREGFKILTDLSKLDTMDQDCRRSIEDVMDLCNQSGVDTIVRVIPEKSKDLGFSIMSIFHYRENVKIFACRTVEEARQYIILTGEARAVSKIAALLKISKAKLSVFSSSRAFRLVSISVLFILLIILRGAVSAFGVSLGYLYVMAISLSGLWFGVKGGLLAALAAVSIFLAEVNIFRYWQARDIVVEGMYLRFLVYFLDGFLFGWLAEIDRKLKKRLEFLAGYDEVCGCYNFRFLMRLLEKEITRSRRYRKEFTIGILDVDYYKEINDEYGHLVGNDILRTFVEIIKINIRTEDVIGRYGGDEFLIIFPESNVKQALVVLEKIKLKFARVKIASSYLGRAENPKVTFSVGVASFPVNGTQIDELINVADTALYQAKNTGRDRIVVSEAR